MVCLWHCYKQIFVFQWKGINRKQSTRWQHLSRLKASTFFSLQKIFSCYETQQLILGTGTAIWGVTEPHWNGKNKKWNIQHLEVSFWSFQRQRWFVNFFKPTNSNLKTCKESEKAISSSKVKRGEWRNGWEKKNTFFEQIEQRM